MAHKKGLGSSRNGRDSQSKAAAPEAVGMLPAGYAELTVAELKKAAGSWDPEALSAALAYEQEHAKRKGAIAALEAAIADKKDEG